MSQKNEALGTTPAGGIVTEGETVKGQRRLRWHKFTAFLVTVALLAVVAVLAIHMAQTEVATIVYPSMAAAMMTALGLFIRGNVQEHQAGVEKLTGIKDMLAKGVKKILPTGQSAK